MGRRGPRHSAGGGGGGFRHGRDGGNNSGGGGESGPPPPPVPEVITEEHPPIKGPLPGYVSVASQYTLEQQLRQMQRENGCDPSREDSYRLQGVQLIDNVRESLRLPVKTFATACTYYHKFRLNFRDAEYNFQDAALSALFVACKVEDTIKKSRDVLCAAYNLKNPDKPTTPDDKLFDRSSTIIVGLDRLILQTVGFDFRVRHPQKLLIKLIRKLIPENDGREFLSVAYPMIVDLYKTFAPIKQTSFTMALSVIELTARILDKHVDTLRSLPLERYHSSRGSIVETLLDLLDLYTHFPKSTKVGMRFDLNRFIEVKIKTNQEVDEDGSLQRVDNWCDKCVAPGPLDGPRHAHAAIITPGSAPSPAPTVSLPAGGSGTIPARSSQKKLDGTLRFLFDADKVRQEQAEVAEYFKEEYDEEEMEVEEVVPEQPARGGGGGGQQHYKSNNGNSNSRGHGPSRRDRNNHHRPPGSANSGNGNGESGWGPYQRNRSNDHRHKPRKGNYY